MGSLPQIPQQNLFLGLPIELMKEEVRLLVDKNLAFVVDDAKWHKQNFINNHANLTIYRETIAALGQAVTQEYQLEQSKRAEKAKAKIAAAAAAKATEKITSSVSTKADMTNEETAEDISERLFEDTTPGTPSANTKKSSAPFAVTPTISYRLPTLIPNNCKLSAPDVPSSYALFKYLHELNYYILPGLRFGCSYNVYPGDPLRFHSHFIAVGFQWEEDMPIFDIIGGGRLATAVKKGFLIGGLDSDSSHGDQENIRTFAIEWGAFKDINFQSQSFDHGTSKLRLASIYHKSILCCIDDVFSLSRNSGVTCPVAHNHDFTTVARQILKKLGIQHNWMNAGIRRAGSYLHEYVMSEQWKISFSTLKTMKDTNDEFKMDFSGFMTQSSPKTANFFGYIIFKWALSYTIVAIVLNRTRFYARTRWSIQLPWKIRFLIRIIPIISLLTQCQKLLQFVNCQTSPQFVMLRRGNVLEHTEPMLTQDRHILHDLSSKLLFGASYEDSCVSVGMVLSESSTSKAKLSHDKVIPKEITKSPPQLWPLFMTLAFSEFVEAISRAVEGRKPATEYGMPLLEHSLAFSEAEAIAEIKLGIKIVEEKSNLAKRNHESREIKTKTRNRSKNLDEAIVSIETLLIGLISTMNHLTSHILAIFDQQSRYRLLNTGVWSLAYIALIMTSFFSFSNENYLDQIFLRLPTVCFISFIPHILILQSIFVCLLIYAIALLLTAFAPPPNECSNGSFPSYRWTFIQKLRSAHQNMQANDTYSNVRVSLRMDFYTVLLRTGLSVMTMTSEAVYLKQSRKISHIQRTWLEENRLQEFEASGVRWLKPSFKIRDLDPDFIDGFSDNIGLALVNGQDMNEAENLSSGYAREMAVRTPGTSSRQLTGAGSHGIGTTERSKRWYLAFEFCFGLSRLWLNCIRSFLLWIISCARVRYQPRWLLCLLLAPSGKPSPRDQEVIDVSENRSLNHNLLGLGDRLEVGNFKLDVEAEFRKKIRKNKKRLTETEKIDLDDSLYRWWLSDGWWGDNDNSGNFQPTKREQDEDTSSIISSSTIDDHRWECDSDDDNSLQTPIQKSPRTSRESTPVNDTTIALDNLVQLLNPKTAEQRAEAQILAAHLSDDQVVTRSRFSRIQESSRAQVLTSSILRPANLINPRPGHKLTLDEEGQILEHLLITRRSTASNVSPGQHSSWTGGTGSPHNGNSLCVVCQSSPRCIIIWPCRCLSLCNDCRVALAMNNFSKCVCCCRDVRSFSRIFVP